MKDLSALIENFFKNPPEWAKPLARDRPLDRNSALIWLPPITAAGLRVPRTESVRIDPDAFWLAIGDGEKIWTHTQPIDWAELGAAAIRIGFPCFVRTDLSSAKHDGPTSYWLNSLDDLQRVCLVTFEDNASKGLATGPTPLRAMLFRQWLDLDAAFTAFAWNNNSGHPIAREFRVFMGGDAEPCIHFYWPEDAIDGNKPSREDWRVLLAEARILTAEEAETLANWAEQAVTAVNATLDQPDRWSVDFAQDRDGSWWLIDMARARDSWHPEHL
jgi:hypothetical protein